MKSVVFLVICLTTLPLALDQPAIGDTPAAVVQAKIGLASGELGPVPYGLPKRNSSSQAQSPHLGRIELGAYAPEAALNYGITNPCLMTFDDNGVYGRYRLAVRSTYGADLSDMNYLGVGLPDWQGRYVWFRNWLFRAAPFGDPTVALEPVGPAGFGIFQDSPEMRCLRQVFQQAKDAGIVVWVRFASESNDEFNRYSVCGSPERIAEYRQSVHWFRSYMPSNIRIVFSPLINDLFRTDSIEVPTLRAMYEPGMYDRIGGTLYATTWVDPEPAYTWYYNYMSALDPSTRFQICELGGTFSKRQEIYTFLLDLKAGKFPKVDRVNLFAGELNVTAIKNHGHFGLVLPGESVSYLHPLIALGRSGGGALPNEMASAAESSKAGLHAGITRIAVGREEVRSLPGIPDLSVVSKIVLPTEKPMPGLPPSSPKAVAAALPPALLDTVTDLAANLSTLRGQDLASTVSSDPVGPADPAIEDPDTEPVVLPLSPIEQKRPTFDKTLVKTEIEAQSLIGAPSYYSTIVRVPVPVQPQPISLPNAAVVVKHTEILAQKSTTAVTAAAVGLPNLRVQVAVSTHHAQRVATTLAPVVPIVRSKPPVLIANRNIDDVVPVSAPTIYTAISKIQPAQEEPLMQIVIEAKHSVPPSASVARTASSAVNRAEVIRHKSIEQNAAVVKSSPVQIAETDSAPSVKAPTLPGEESVPPQVDIPVIQPVTPVKPFPSTSDSGSDPKKLDRVVKDTQSKQSVSIESTVISKVEPKPERISTIKVAQVQKPRSESAPSPILTRNVHPSIQLASLPPIQATIRAIPLPVPLSAAKLPARVVTVVPVHIAVVAAKPIEKPIAAKKPVRMVKPNLMVAQVPVEHVQLPAAEPLPVAAPLPSAKPLQSAEPLPTTSVVPVASVVTLRSGWRSPIMTIKGVVIAASSKYQTFVIEVSDVIDAAGNDVTISPVRKKRVYLQPTATISSVNGTVDSSQLSSLTGQTAEVTGWDRGTGTPLEASVVSELPN